MIYTTNWTNCWPIAPHCIQEEPMPNQAHFWSGASGGPERAIDCSRTKSTLWLMKASPVKPAVQRQCPDSMRPEQVISDDGIDLSMLKESLAKTVWERMLANDDALRLADLFQTAMLKSRAKP